MSTQDEFLAAQSELVKKLQSRLALSYWALTFSAVALLGLLIHELNGLCH
jgi:hypothetical protein